MATRFSLPAEEIDRKVQESLDDKPELRRLLEDFRRRNVEADVAQQASRREIMDRIDTGPAKRGTRGT